MPRITVINIDDVEKTCQNYRGPHSVTWLKEIAIPAAEKEVKRMQGKKEDDRVCTPCTDPAYSQNGTSPVIHLMWRPKPDDEKDQKKEQAVEMASCSGPYHDNCVKEYERVFKNTRYQALARNPGARLDELPRLKDINTNEPDVLLTPRGTRYEFFVLKFDPGTGSAAEVKEEKDKEAAVLIDIKENRLS